MSVSRNVSTFLNVQMDPSTRRRLFQQWMLQTCGSEELCLQMLRALTQGQDPWIYFSQDAYGELIPLTWMQALLSAP